MHVLGHVARTANALEGQPERAQLPRLWSHAPELAAAHGPDRLRAVYFDYEGDHEAPYTVLVGVEVPERVEPAAESNRRATTPRRSRYRRERRGGRSRGY